MDERRLGCCGGMEKGEFITKKMADTWKILIRKIVKMPN